MWVPRALVSIPGGEGRPGGAGTEEHAWALSSSSTTGQPWLTLGGILMVSDKFLNL